MKGLGRPRGGAKSISLRTVQNVLWRFFSGGWRALLTLSTTPYVVRGLGEEAYGLLALVLSFIGYFVVLDLDLGTAVTKYVAEFRAKGDSPTIRKIVETSLFVYLLMGALLALFFLAAGDFFVAQIIHVSPGKREMAKSSLALIGLSFLFNMPTWIFGAVLQACHRFDLLSKLSFAFTTLIVGGTVILVAAGRGLIDVLWLNVAVALLTLIAHALAARGACPAIAFRPRFDPPTARMIFSFSLVTFLGRLVANLWFRIDRLLISALISASAVTYYAVAYLPVLMMLRLAAVFQNVALPLASEFYGGEEGPRVRILYLRASKLAFLLILACGLPLFIFGDFVLALWMGGDFAPKGTLTLRLLIVGQAVMVLSSIASTITLGLTRPWFQTLFSTGMALLSLPIFLLFIPRLGIAGAALGLTLPPLVLYPVYLVMTNRILDIPNEIFLNQVVGRAVLSTLGAGGISWVFLRAWASSPLGLAMASAGCLALFAFFILSLGALNREDRETFRLALLSFQRTSKMASG